jgi:hypothetical protein
MPGSARRWSGSWSTGSTTASCRRCRGRRPAGPGRSWSWPTPSRPWSGWARCWAPTAGSATPPRPWPSGGRSPTGWRPRRGSPCSPGRRRPPPWPWPGWGPASGWPPSCRPRPPPPSTPLAPRSTPTTRPSAAWPATRCSRRSWPGCGTPPAPARARSRRRPGRTRRRPRDRDPGGGGRGCRRRCRSGSRPRCWPSCCGPWAGWTRTCAGRWRPSPTPRPWSTGGWSPGAASTPSAWPPGWTRSPCPWSRRPSWPASGCTACWTAASAGCPTSSPRTRGRGPGWSRCTSGPWGRCTRPAAWPSRRRSAWPTPPSARRTRPATRPRRPSSCAGSRSWPVRSSPASCWPPARPGGCAGPAGPGARRPAWPPGATRGSGVRGPGPALGLRPLAARLEELVDPVDRDRPLGPDLARLVAALAAGELPVC